MSGLTPDGFVPKTTEDIRGENVAQILADVDATMDLSDSEGMGQIVGIESGSDAELWELLGAIYDGFDPDKAEGDQLDAVGALRGIPRKGALKSFVLMNVTLAVGVYAIGALKVNATGSDIVWSNVAQVSSLGGVNAGVRFEPPSEGPLAANSGTLTNITVPVTGFTAATNPLDAEPGRLLELDPAYRLRQAQEIADQGASSLPAIRAKLLKVPGVQSVRLRENTTLATVDGLPGKSFECIIWDGVSMDAADDAIAAAIWGDKPSGMQAFGQTSVNVTDDDGDVHAIGFTRATQKTVFLSYVIVVDPALYPTDGDDQVKAAGVAAGELYAKKPGDDVIALRLKYAPFDVAGVLDVTTFTLDFVTSPAPSVNLPIAIDEMATFDTSRVAVTS